MTNQRKNNVFDIRSGEPLELNTEIESPDLYCEEAETPVKETHVQRYRGTKANFPSIAPHCIMRDLVDSTPEHQDRWFATSKKLVCLKLPTRWAMKGLITAKTVSRAPRDYIVNQPEFALASGLVDLGDLLHGNREGLALAEAVYARTATLKAAEILGQEAEVCERIRNAAHRVLKDKPESLMAALLAGTYLD